VIVLPDTQEIATFYPGDVVWMRSFSLYTISLDSRSGKIEFQLQAQMWLVLPFLSAALFQAKRPLGFLALNAVSNPPI